MYQIAIDNFSTTGFEQYEISAFCQKGFESKHNCGYWTGRPFLGLGPSAYGYWDGARMRNVANLNKYIRALEKEKSAVDFYEKLEPDARLRERLVIALRMMQGVNVKNYSALENEIITLMHQGLLMRNGDHIQLTQLGVLHYDTVASELI